MNELLADIKAKLQSGDFKNEEHIRLSLVARVLQNLGWDIWNPKEVNTEFIVVPNEDKTRVDIALFLRPYAPAVFIEIKGVGEIQRRLADIERQLRDYNRNHTAMFTIITDGREWRFYYSQTGGEFSKKCFQTLNFAVDNLNDIEESLVTFLRRSEIENGNAKHKAENYLQKNQRQQTAEDCLPEARRKISEPPYPSLPAALVSLVSEEGFSITQDEAVKFIKEADERKPSAPIAYQATQASALYSDRRTESQPGRHEVNSDRTPGKKRAYVSLVGRSALIRRLRDDGNDWTTAWGKILVKYPGSSITNCRKVWEKEARTPRTVNPINSKGKAGGKMAFVEAHLTATGENRKTKSEIVKLYMKEFPGVSEKTARNTVNWSATTLKRRTGKASNHLPNAH